MPAQIHSLDTRPDTPYLREALRLLVQSFIEAETSAHIEADHYERNDSRRTQRNGYRKRSWRTQMGDITLFIPKLRKGTYYPEFLDTLRQSEPALVELAEESYQRDVRVQDIERIAYRLGLAPIHRSQLATIEEQLHELAQRYKFHSFAITNTNGAPISALYSADELDWIGQSAQTVLGQAQILDLAA